MICNRCHERPVPPSHLKQGRWQCWRCREHTAAALARRKRYRASLARKAVMKRDNAKRIFVGHDYYGRAATVEQARAATTHATKRRQQYREAMRAAQ
jgi:hypothetical protein